MRTKTLKIFVGELKIVGNTSIDGESKFIHELQNETKTNLSKQDIDKLIIEAIETSLLYPKQYLDRYPGLQTNPNYNFDSVLQTVEIIYQ